MEPTSSQTDAAAEGASKIIEAQPGSRARRGTLLILACHGVFDVLRDLLYAEHPGDRPIYEAHLAYALQHLMWREIVDPLLVISGGFTKPEIHCSESRSYLQLAKARCMAVPANVALEEYALVSPENVLFSLYVYHKVRGVWPERVEAISWEFKRERFELTLEAINQWQPLKQSWPGLEFFPVGDLPEEEKAIPVRKEEEYCAALSKGPEAYYALKETKDAIARRDPHHSREAARAEYKGYPLPF